MMVSFEYEGKSVKMQMAGGTDYKGGRVTYLSEIKKSYFDGQLVIGFLSDLEKSEHEKVVEVMAHLAKVGKNDEKTLKKLEHIGEIGEGYSVSLAFFGEAST